MRERRLPLLFGLGSLTAMLTSPAAWAITTHDVGGWGTAWGEPSISSTDMDMSAADMGSWGSAWDNSTMLPPPPLSPPAPIDPPISAPAAAPVAVPAPSAVSSAAQPAAASGNKNHLLPAPNGVSLRPTVNPLPAPAFGSSTPVNLTADEMLHDRDMGIVTARGKVEAVQGGRMLRADVINYNTRADLISASGNVSLMEPSGETVTSNYMELTGDFKEGLAQEIRLMLADRSRMKAATTRRKGGNLVEMEQVSYTACEPCKSNPDAAPLWEIKAEKVTHNQAEKVIEYEDATVEVMGLPVAWVPWMSHADPSVRRKSGFLFPKFRQNPGLGPNITTPYFIVIDDQQDLTVLPRFMLSNVGTGKEGKKNPFSYAALSAEHRWRGTDGKTRTIVSATGDRYDGHFRGHIDADGEFFLSDQWRAGYKVQRSSDDTYSNVYGYRFRDYTQPWLTTRPYLEGFGRQNYGLAEAFAFQGLRLNDNQDMSPVVLPHLRYQYLGTPDEHGGYWSSLTDVLAYRRLKGPQTARMSVQGAYTRPFIGYWGDVTTVTASLRTDGYVSSQLYGADGTEPMGRVIPQIAVNWRMPFVSPGAVLSQTIEPMLMFAASPKARNGRLIPNEDAVAFELDETSVMRPDRMSGLDRVEGGIRGAYGLRWSGNTAEYGSVVAQVAQGWRARKDDVWGYRSGFEHNMSDYMGRIDLNLSQNLSLLNRVRLDRKDLSLRRQENTLTIGSNLLRFSGTYLYKDDGGIVSDERLSPEVFARRHSLLASVSGDVTRNVSGAVGLEQRLTGNPGLANWWLRGVYSDDCFALVGMVYQSYTYDRDIRPGTNFTLNVVFKTLGSTPVGLF